MNLDKSALAFGAGLIISITGGWYIMHALSTVHTHEDQHPIGYADSPDEVHLHSDFLVYLDGKRVDLTGEEFQTTSSQTKHKQIHLHDNIGHVIHRHANEITLEEFMESLGFDITDICITFNGTEYCDNQSKQITTYINGEPNPDWTSYVNQEEDQILIFYGQNDDPIIESLLQDITDESCIYSGTCPERGVAPAESCGLTCEL